MNLKRVMIAILGTAIVVLLCFCFYRGPKTQSDSDDAARISSELDAGDKRIHAAQKELESANEKARAVDVAAKARDAVESQEHYRTYLQTVAKSRKAQADLHVEQMRSKIASGAVTPEDGARQIEEIKAANEKEIADILSRAAQK